MSAPVSRRPVVSHHPTSGASSRRYVTGFASSLVLTSAAFYLAQHGLGSGQGGWLLAIAGLAFGQIVLQLVCFLHVGHERAPRWRLAMLAGMAIVVCIVVIGSLWIMRHLNYNMMRMSPDELQTQMHSEEGL